MWPWNSFNGTTTAAGNQQQALSTCTQCGSSFFGGPKTHMCGPNGGTWAISPTYTTTYTTGATGTNVMSWPTTHRTKLTKLHITGTAVILEDEYGNGVEIALDIVRRLAKFDEVEALAALDALRK